ncbi:MAG: hypothetical protein U5R31_11435 [Acidimicrobiia bacterium]|nr:hypothetical protein [Acidimicrobiia bacterium]
MYAWPWIEARVTGDRREHHVIDRPRDRPVRTAIGVGALLFYTVLVAAGADDVIATTFGMSVNATLWAFRVLLVAAPVLGGLLACKLLPGAPASGRPLRRPTPHRGGRGLRISRRRRRRGIRGRHPVPRPVGHALDHRLGEVPLDLEHPLGEVEGVVDQPVDLLTVAGDEIGGAVGEVAAGVDDRLLAALDHLEDLGPGRCGSPRRRWCRAPARPWSMLLADDRNPAIVPHPTKSRSPAPRASDSDGISEARRG